MSRAAMLNNLNVEESDKINVLLRDTVLLLCHNGFNFELGVKVQGLVAITLDNKDVYLVKFDDYACRTPSNPPETDLQGDIPCEAPPDHQVSRKCGRGSKNRLRECKAARARSGAEVIEEIYRVQNFVGEMGKGFDDPLRDIPQNCSLSQSLIHKEGSTVDVEDSSTVSIKEESEHIQFDMSTFHESQETGNLDMKSHLPVLGGGMGTGDGSLGNEVLWSLPLANVSGRGRRARRSGQKMYSCEHPGCGLSFYRSYTLYRHQRLKHGQRLVPPAHQQNKISQFRCPVQGCDQVFMRPSILEKHSKEVHQHEYIHLMGPESFLVKNELERFHGSDLLFDGMEYGLLSR